MIIPFPTEPSHVDNLASLDLLEAQGFGGTDATLGISLFEYDIIWRKLETPVDGCDYLFVYRINNEPGVYEFDCSLMDSSKDPRKEFNWVNWDSLADTHGTTKEEWFDLPFEIRIADLQQFCGYENIFGASTWGGFKIEASDWLDSNSDWLKSHPE